MYHNLLSGIPDTSEAVIRELWELEDFALDSFERQVKQMKLDTFFKNE
jgi:hypothetical protein